MKYSIAALLVLLTLSAGAQNTFIKRYKNTTIAESGVAVCLLPNNQYAIVGKQANGFAWQSPMIVIADSTGKQLRHWVDTTCAGCEVTDAVTDSAGFIYVVGNFYGRAGLVKYDTIGNRVWFRSESMNGLEASFSSISIYNNMIFAAGVQLMPSATGSQALVICYDFNGDTIWTLASKFTNGNVAPFVGILNIKTDSSCIYSVGVVSDTLPERMFFARIDIHGNLLNYKEIGIQNRGYDVCVLNNNSIIIGGYETDQLLRYYSSLYIIDSTGMVLSYQGDSNDVYNYIARLDYNTQINVLAILNFDTIGENGISVEHDKISVYQLPITNLQQPLWEKTITGTSSGPTLRDMKVLPDGSVLHTSTAIENCPNCPYLAKINKDACTDMACDTGFITGIVAPTLVNVTFKLYPNPSKNYFTLEYDLYQSVKQGLTVVVTDIAGRTVATQSIPAVSAGHGVANIDIQHLAEGAYWVTIKDGERSLGSKPLTKGK